VHKRNEGVNITEKTNTFEN